MKNTKFVCKLLSCFFLLLLVTQFRVAGQITMATGKYIGTGIDNEIISGLGFQPDVVIVKVSETTNEAQIRTSSMEPGYSRQMVGSSAVYLNRIKSFTSDGFMIGDNNDVNNPGKTYYWTAFKTSANLIVGSYTGDGTDARPITGLGFSPDLVILLPTEGNRASFRTSTFTDEDASAFGSDFNLHNTIEAMLPNGFRVGDEPRANKDGSVFHYVAFKAAPGSLKVGSYVGNSIDNRTISGVGFSPSYMFIKSNSNNYATQKSVQMPNDASIEFSGSRTDDNRIRDFNPDGFVVGTQAQVNNNNNVYHYVCFRNFIPGLQISDFVIFGGDKNCPSAPGLTIPAGPNPCKVNIGTGSVINGNIGSYSFIQCQGASTINGNIHSGGKVNFQNSVYSGGISAANRLGETGEILFTGNEAEINGNIDVNGNVQINPNAGSYITGYLRHPSGTTYSGPLPGGGEIIAPPNLPVLPQMPDTLNFQCPSVGPNVTATQTISPGSYGNLTLGNTPATITFDGPGSYFFNTIQMQQGGIHRFIYDLKNQPGLVRIYVCGDVKLGDFIGSFVNPTNAGACRVYFETHGTGSTNGNEFSFILEPSSTFQGFVWAPYAGIKIGAGSGVVNITGALWSTTVVDINAGITVNPCSLCDQSITITKVVEGRTPLSDWSFTSDIPGHSTFTLPAAGGSIHFPGVAVGNYSVTELPKDVPNSNPVRQYTVINTCGTGNTSSISLGACENKQCTFTNSCLGTLKVMNVFNNFGLPIPAPTDWEFTISPPIGGVSSFILPGAGGSRIFTDVPSGVTYTITEALKEDTTCLASGNYFATQNSSGTGRVGNISVAGCGDSVITFTNTPSDCNRCALLVDVNSPTRCSNGSAVTISATPSIPGTYTYAWTVPGGVPNPGNVASFSATVAGTYSVTVSDGVFCSISASGTLTVNPNPTVTVNSPTRCSSDPAATITATPSPSGSYNYAWTVPGGVPDPGNVASFSSTVAGTYSVTITNPTTGCTGSGSGTLTVTSNPTVTVNSPSRCADGAAVTITATPSPAGSYNYAWTVPGGVPNPGNVASFSATTAGSYSVVITLVGSTCTGSGSGTLTVNPNPAVTVNSPSRCANDPASTITATPSPSGSYNYSWTVPGGVPNPGNVASFSATTAGTYSVTITNTTTGCTGSGSGTLTVNPNPTVTVNSPTRCSSDPATTITATPSPSGSYNYAWTVPGGVPNPGNVASFSSTVAGTYSVTITNSSTGCTGSGSGTLTVTSNPTVTVNSPSRCADGAAVTITATPSPAGSYNYAWTVPGGVPNPGNVASFSATTAGSYSVVITLVGSTCTGSGSGTLTVNPNPAVTVNSPTRCANGPASIITATPSPSGSYNYAWTVPGGVPNPGNVASFSATVAGTYSVTITNTTTNCTGSGSGTLTVNPNPTVTVNSASRCANAPAVTITATPSPAGSYNYVWTVPGGVSNPGNVASFSASVAGTYSVTITNTATGCTGTGSGTLTVNPLPAVTCTADNLAQTLTANPSGGTPPYSYSWNTSPIKTTQTITVTDENIYTVTVTDSKGCTASTSCSVNTCNGFTTVTQGGWGATPKGSNPAKYLSRKFSQAFPGPDYLTIGCATGNKLRLTSASAIEIFLPSGSTPRALPAGTLVNPGQTYQNVLAGQLVAATLNVTFDDIDPTFSSSHIKLKDLIVNFGPFAGWTVAQVIAEANNLIGGCPSTAQFSAMNNALDQINNNFDYGIRNGGFLSCPGTFPLAVFSKSASNGISNSDQSGDDEVMVYPNPFHQSTRIRFRAELTNVNGKVDIVSTDGKLLATIFNQRVKAGEYYIAEFNYPQLPAGIYFYRITMGGKIINGKIVKTR